VKKVKAALEPVSRMTASLKRRVLKDVSVLFFRVLPSSRLDLAELHQYIET
jgi:hypothetical protein